MVGRRVTYHGSLTNEHGPGWTITATNHGRYDLTHTDGRRLIDVSAASFTTEAVAS